MGSHVATASGTTDSSVTTLAASSSVAVQAGDAIFVVSNYDGSLVVVTPTDNASGGSNSYIERSVANYPSVFVCHTHVAIAKASETLTVSTNLDAARPYVSVHVIVARPTSGYEFVFDAQRSAYETGSSTAATTGAFTIAGAGGFAVTGCGAYASGVTFTAGTGWTLASQVGYMGSQYRAITNETSITGEITLSTATQWVITAVALKEQAVEGGGPPIQSLLATITRNIPG
jgi:hypothetical protein